jgi:RHS repeat-associated protein
MGRRIGQGHSDANTDPSRSLFYSKNWQVIEEWKDTHLFVEQIFSPLYVDQLIISGRDADLDGGWDNAFLPTQDANLNVTALVNWSDGTILERFQYDPYGAVTYLDANGSAKTTQESAYEWVQLFQGLRLDADTGQYDSRSRAYDPTLGRFLQQDKRVT